MNVVLLTEAAEEFAEAAIWYESREPGLGARFRDEVTHVLKRVAEDPTLWRERMGGYRRVNCPAFPFYVAYVIRDDTIIVAAVAHGHRMPGYWKGRTY